MSYEYLITTLIIAASPGTGVLVTLAAGLSRGPKAAIIAALGCTLGIIPHMLAAISGLAALLHTSALAFQIIKYAGVAYLLYMAWATFRDHDALSVSADTVKRSNMAGIRSAILVNLLNPKLSIFFLAFLPQFVPAQSPYAVLEMINLSLVFMLVTFLVFVIYGVFAASVRDAVAQRPVIVTALRKIFAGAFVALGARLALTER